MKYLYLLTLSLLISCSTKESFDNYDFKSTKKTSNNLTVLKNIKESDNNYNLTALKESAFTCSLLPQLIRYFNNKYCFSLLYYTDKLNSVNTDACNKNIKEDVLIKNLKSNCSNEDSFFFRQSVDLCSVEKYCDAYIFEKTNLKNIFSKYCGAYAKNINLCEEDREIMLSNEKNLCKDLNTKANKLNDIILYEFTSINKLELNSGYIRTVYLIDECGNKLSY